MDVFTRTFLPAAAEAAVGIPTVSRHMPVLRRCVEPGDTTVLVTRCTRPERAGQAPGYLMLLTERRLVVTSETRLTRRLRLHLNAELRHLDHVTWNPDPRLGIVEFAATAVDGIRERFQIRTSRPAQVWRLDALLSHAFRVPATIPPVRYAPGTPITAPGSTITADGRLLPLGTALA
ncbi:hypothetical protein [Plantactinospora sp. KBS50]|uniref:hypothetical protein n=1 Tax=Plantactinospora sp. KBS50 TaxID=2024580 RepID=UPI0018E058CE|nr:hypothetical protein [Plantactinospora sp. KBS50]